jgi:hypothetical protein
VLHWYNNQQVLLLAPAGIFFIGSEGVYMSLGYGRKHLEISPVYAGIIVLAGCLSTTY